MKRAKCARSLHDPLVIVATLSLSRNSRVAKLCGPDFSL
jgi:hypothetical protein